jgi:putative flippase GtrA
MLHLRVATRWTRFNAVGAVGVAVQLGVLAVTMRVWGWHYLVATAIAVEAAVLHNFFWHQRWTWRDRPAVSRRIVLARLLQFQLLNGVISLAGNLGLMALLTAAFGLKPLLANAIAIAACSLVNFVASEMLVFRRATESMLLSRTPNPAHGASGT